MPIFFHVSVPPGPPVIKELTSDFLSISATWNRSRDDGGSPILAYRITLLDANKKEQQMQSGIKQNKYTFQNLKHNRTYTILLQAGNIVGYGKLANVSVSTLQAGKAIIQGFCISVSSSVIDIHSIVSSCIHPFIFSAVIMNYFKSICSCSTLVILLFAFIYNKCNFKPLNQKVLFHHSFNILPHFISTTTLTQSRNDKKTI